MSGRSQAALAGAALTVAGLLAGCGSSSHAAPSPACSESPAAVLRALAAAPGAVRLRDGTALSRCVARALDDGPLQDVGATFASAADGLAARAPRDRAAALQLGYLVGATRRGAARTNGVAAELTRRIERAGAMSGAAPELLAAERDGIVAGTRGG